MTTHRNAVMDSKTLPEAFNALVPQYKNEMYRPLMLTVRRYDRRFARELRERFPTQAEARWTAYVNPREVARVSKKLETKKEALVRTGVLKTGLGYQRRERADFCLAGAGIEDRKLTLLYRSLELSTGLAHDLSVVDMLSDALGIEWSSLIILAGRAHLRAVPWPYNERVYATLKEVLCS